MPRSCSCAAAHLFLRDPAPRKCFVCRGTRRPLATPVDIGWELGKLPLTQGSPERIVSLAPRGLSIDMAGTLAQINGGISVGFASGQTHYTAGNRDYIFLQARDLYQLRGMRASVAIFDPEGVFGDEAFFQASIVATPWRIVWQCDPNAWRLCSGAVYPRAHERTLRVSLRIDVVKARPDAPYRLRVAWSGSGSGQMLGGSWLHEPAAYEARAALHNEVKRGAVGVVHDPLGSFSLACHGANLACFEPCLGTVASRLALGEALFDVAPPFEDPSISYLFVRAEFGGRWGLEFCRSGADAGRSSLDLSYVNEGDARAAAQRVVNVVRSRLDRNVDIVARDPPGAFSFVASSRSIGFIFPPNIGTFEASLEMARHVRAFRGDIGWHTADPKTRYEREVG
jgi:hypothetical protein